MPRKQKNYDPSKVKGNFGPGAFSDQYDNNFYRSLDDDENPGGVTYTPFEDDIDLLDMNFNTQKGESWLSENHAKLHEPNRDADLSLGEAGTRWNAHLRPDFSGRGPKGWKLSDEKLKERICDVLMQSHDVDPSHFEVVVEDGVVTLKGEIQSKGMKRVAEDLVGSIPGVIDVFTELKSLS
jgi:hypothetical protein